MSNCQVEFYNYFIIFILFIFILFIFSQLSIEFANDSNTYNANNTNRLETRTTYAFTRRFVRIVSSPASGTLSCAIAIA